MVCGSIDVIRCRDCVLVIFIYNISYRFGIWEMFIMRVLKGFGRFYDRGDIELGFEK